MRNSYLLDSNIILLWLMGGEECSIIVQKLSQEQVTAYTSIIVVGKLYHAARRSSRILTLLGEFMNDKFVLLCDDAIARCYAKIKQDLKQSDQRMPDNNIWIAATAVDYDLILVSRDPSFTVVRDLRLETW